MGANRTSRAAAIAALIVACGPAVNSQQVRGPDGTTDWLSIQCDDLQANCVQRAGEACPSGYDIADSRGHNNTGSASYAVVGPDGATAGTSSRSKYEGEMLVKCHGEMSPSARGYRDCIGDASCNTGDKCIFTTGAGRDLGRCQAGR
ncbi:MAG: hypothetical protein JWO86_7726 [Myxococcaceae bacterium]|nr:hypothetical protein [Myxococcaceae bacterium]